MLRGGGEDVLEHLHDAPVVGHHRRGEKRVPGAAAELFPSRAPEVVSGQAVGEPAGSWFDAVRGLVSRGARIDEAVKALDGAGLPSAVHEAPSVRLIQGFGSGTKAAAAELDRFRAVVDRPWAKSSP